MNATCGAAKKPVQATGAGAAGNPQRAVGEVTGSGRAIHRCQPAYHRRLRVWTARIADTGLLIVKRLSVFQNVGKETSVYAVGPVPCQSSFRIRDIAFAMCS